MEFNRELLNTCPLAKECDTKCMLRFGSHEFCEIIKGINKTEAPQFTPAA